MAKLFRKILVPHDASDHATRALNVAAQLAAEAGGRLVVLQAVAPFLPFADLGADEGTSWIPPEDVIASELASLENRVRKALRGRSAPPVECRVVVGEPYRSIMNAAADVDLIVLATHGRTGLEHLVIGSVAEKVVRHAPVPVLTIRPEAFPGVERRGARRAGPARAARAS